MALEGRVTYLDRMPEADAAYGRMPRTPRDTASTIGRSAASVARRLHAQSRPHPLKCALRSEANLGTRVTYLDRMPEADAAYGRMPRTPRDTASTIGRSAASVARRLHGRAGLTL